MAVRGDSPGWQIVGWWERSPRVSCSAGSSGSKNGCQVLMVEEEEEAVLLLLLLLLFWDSSCFAGGLCFCFCSRFAVVPLDM